MAVSNIDPDPEMAAPVGVYKATLTVADGNSNVEVDIDGFNGVITQIIFNVPALTGSTSELLLHNEDNDEIYTSGERAESLKHTLTFTRAFAGTLTLRAEVDTQQSGSTAVHTVTIYFTE